MSKSTFVTEHLITFNDDRYYFEIEDPNGDGDICFEIGIRGDTFSAFYLDRSQAIVLIEQLKLWVR